MVESMLGSETRFFKMACLSSIGSAIRIGTDGRRIAKLERVVGLAQVETGSDTKASSRPALWTARAVVCTSKMHPVKVQKFHFRPSLMWSDLIRVQLQLPKTVPKFGPKLSQMWFRFWLYDSTAFSQHVHALQWQL